MAERPTASYVPPRILLTQDRSHMMTPTRSGRLASPRSIRTAAVLGLVVVASCREPMPAGPDATTAPAPALAPAIDAGAAPDGTPSNGTDVGSCEAIRAVDLSRCGTRDGFKLVIGDVTRPLYPNMAEPLPVSDPVLAKCYADALFACESTASAAPFDRAGLGETYGTFARTLRGLGFDVGEIATRMQTVAARHPKAPELALVAAEWLLRVSRAEEARALLAPACAKTVDAGEQYPIASCHEFLGRALLALGRAAEAEKVLARSLAALSAWENESPVNKYWGCPYQAMGELYSARGDLRRNRELMRRAADAESFKHWPQLEAAVACLAVGDLAGAAEYAARASKLGEAAGSEAVTRAVSAAGDAPPESSAKPREAYFAEAAARVASSLAGFKAVNAFRYARRAQELDPTPARAALEAQLDRRAKVPGDPLTAAVTAFDLSDMSEAVRLAKSAPDTPVANAVSGLASMFLKDYAAAEGVVRKLRAGRSDSAEADLIEGHLAIARRDFRTARASLTRAESALAPSTPDQVLESPRKLLLRLVHLGLGWVDSNETRYADSIARFDRMLALRLDDTLALLAKGNSLSGLKKPDEARKCFETVLALNPGDPYAQAELGLLDYNAGRLESAEALFKAALSTEGERYTCPFEGLGLVYLRQGKLDLAKQNFERAIEINPDVEYKKYNGLAKIHIAAGNFAKARELLERSARNFPFDPEARELLESLRADAGP